MKPWNFFQLIYVRRRNGVELVYSAQFASFIFIVWVSDQWGTLRWCHGTKNACRQDGWRDFPLSGKIGTTRTFTFFEKSNLTIKDIMLIVKFYLDKCTLLECSNLLGTNWASHMREIFKEHFHRHTKHKREVPRGVQNSKVRRQDKFRRDWSRH